MEEIIQKGTWVEVMNTVLQPEDRSSQLPEDTKQCAYEMKVRGFLLEDTALNDEAEIQTLSGRVLRGKLIEENPAFEHSFGPPILELLHIGERELEMIQHQK